MVGLCLSCQVGFGLSAFGATLGVALLFVLQHKGLRADHLIHPSVRDSFRSLFAFPSESFAEDFSKLCLPCSPFFPLSLAVGEGEAFGVSSAFDRGVGKGAGQGLPKLAGALLCPALGLFFAVGVIRSCLALVGIEEGQQGSGT